MQDTIYALATGSQASAICIIRVSGPAAWDTGRRFCGVDLRPREARYVSVRDPADQELIDSGLVLFFAGPASFTGEDSLEFQLHGSRAVIARMLKALGREAGLRMAEPGEFIRRAFDNGKMALTSIEGVADLIDAQTDLQRRQALAQAGGGLASKAQHWRELLLHALALVTAEIDFADEGESPQAVASEVRAIVEQLHTDYQRALDGFSRAEMVRNGFRVVLCGPPNAGKSSLLNALARRDVAIVTAHAGTTRDIIEVQLDLEGASVSLLDTAGLRDAADEVEAIGIERSRAAIEAAHLVVWVQPALDEICSVVATSGPIVRLASKLDKANAPPAWADVACSAVTGRGLDEVERLISDQATAQLAGEAPIVTNARQRACLDAGVKRLSELLKSDFSAMEIVADDLLASADRLQELVGRIGTEDILGAVFSRFCMGK